MSNQVKGGVRPPDYLYELALSRTEDLMQQAVPWPQIVAKLLQEGFTESEETALNWRRAVMKRWAAEDAEMRPARKDLWRTRLERLYEKILSEAGTATGYAKAQLYAELIRVAKLSIAMDGVASPVVVRHEGQVDVAAMAPYERENEIAELLKKRADAQKRAEAAQVGKGHN